MNFDEILDQVSKNLQREERISYRLLMRRYNLSENDIEDLKHELIDAKGLAHDENEKVLVWNAVEKESVTPLAERRHLTVVFFDLVDSTKLSNTLEIEDFRDIVLAYQRTVVAAIIPHNGYIAQYLGDGVLVYFGYPVAREDDAQRALEGALDTVETFKETARSLRNQFGVEPTIRVGIHTGIVVVGDVGGESKSELIAIGDTPNIAARLQGEAEPNQVVVGNDTYSLVKHHFEFESLGDLNLKGIAHPVTAYVCSRRVGERGKFQILLHRQRSNFQGRNDELKKLGELSKKATVGAGMVVFIEGEGGIGKSRLILELRNNLEKQKVTSELLECSPFHTGTYLYPVIKFLESCFGIADSDILEAKQQKVETALTNYDISVEQVLALFLSLLGISKDPIDALHLTPQRQRQLTQQAIIDFLKEYTSKKQCLIVFEDLHWCDPSTLEIITSLTKDKIPGTMLVLTSRPGLQQNWEQIEFMALGQILDSDAEAIVRSIDEQNLLSKEFIQTIVGRADGIPLFLEELTKAVISNESLDAEQTTPFRVPTTLRDTLFARLDHLPNGKAVAQLGAVVGRDFSQELLDYVWSGNKNDLQTGLHELTGSGLLEQKRIDHKLIYSFKHALIRDVAYESLLLRQRVEYHHNIARILESEFSANVASQPEILAYHYGAARDYRMALTYWSLSSIRAQRRSAHREALSHIEQALSCLAKTSDIEEADETRLQLLNQKGNNLIAIKGYASQSVGEVYIEAHDLSSSISDKSLRFDTVQGLWAYHTVRGDLHRSLELTHELIEIAETENLPEITLEAVLRHGISLSLLGDLTQAKENFEKVLSLYDAERDLEHHIRYGQDPRVSCLCHLSLVLWLLGYPDQALRKSSEALELALELNHPFSLSWAYLYLALIHYLRRENDLSFEVANKLIKLCSEQAFAYRLAQGQIIRAWAQQGTEEGADSIRNSLKAVRASGALIYATYYYAILAEVESNYSLDAAKEALSEGLLIASSTNESMFKAELLRMQALMAMRQESKPEVALEQLEEALQIASKQDSKSLILRILTSIYDIERSNDTKQELKKIVASIHEGKNLKDFQEAAQLLEIG